MVRVSEGLSAPPAQLVTRLLHRRTKRAPGYISLSIPDPPPRTDAQRTDSARR